MSFERLPGDLKVDIGGVDWPGRACSNGFDSSVTL